MSGDWQQRYKRGFETSLIHVHVKENMNEHKAHPLVAYSERRVFARSNVWLRERWLMHQCGGRVRAAVAPFLRV